jgi:hypothetical protein
MTIKFPKVEGQIKVPQLCHIQLQMWRYIYTKKLIRVDSSGSWKTQALLSSASG